MKNQITTISETAIFADPVKYADKFIRNADGSLNYINTTNQNLGVLKLLVLMQVSAAFSNDNYWTV